jgi:polyvinyl alcohol dehydrogenase (cytochrome)
LVAKVEAIKEPDNLIKLWLHESERVYGDRLVSIDDLGKYRALALATAKKKFASSNLGEFFGDKVKLDPTAGGGLFALDLATGKALWSAPAVSCAGRERCSPAQTAAVTAIPGVVFSGSMSGVMRAFDSDTGKELWSYDSVRDYKTVNGAAGRGGAIDQSGVVVVDGWVYMNSGYAQWGAQPGNVLLAYSVDGK